MIRKNLLRNNVAIALNILYPEKEEIYHAYVSKCNSNSEKQVICYMVPNCLNWLHSFATEKKLKSHQNVCLKLYASNCNYGFWRH